MRLYDRTFSSRLMLGTALYPSPAAMREAIMASGAEIVTFRCAGRRGDREGRAGFLGEIRDLGLAFLPNTAAATP